jgi:hypothetical protein
VSKCAKELQNSFEEYLSTMGFHKFLMTNSWLLILYDDARTCYK